MNDGKTTTSLALFSALSGVTPKVGFIKPVGQRFLDVEGQSIDEDSVLIEQIFDTKVPIEAMSPIAIHSNFTRDFLDDPEENHAKLVDRMCRAFDRAAHGQEYIIVEGTGHAGVGSIFNLCNAQVAKRLEAKVVIVARGGIGRPIDEIALNKALFDQAGVDVIGAIINKVATNKLETVKKYCGIALERMGVPLLGCIPIEEKLAVPKLNQIVKNIEGSWLNGDSQAASVCVNQVFIGDMAARGLVDLMAPGSLIITPGDREDILLAAIAAEGIAGEKVVSGIILTYGMLPHKKLMDMIAKTAIPVITCSDDSYAVASKINQMTVKTQPSDSDKIPIIKNLINQYVDLDAIRESFQAETFPK
jgi:BioD-like phosphotransacetylase family protein